MSFVLGMNAKMYFQTNTATAFTNWPGSGAPPNLAEMELVQNVTLNIDLATADVTTRGGSGWRQTVATLRDATVDFDILWDQDFTTAAEELAALVWAVMNNGTLNIAVLDGATTHGTGNDPHRGLWAPMMVVSFPRAEELESALNCSVSMRPTYSSVAPEWVTTNVV